MRFFITGNSSIQDGLDLDFIAPVNCGSGNFASKGQTLPQSYSIAKNIFRLVGKDKINFVLIGLTADALFLDENENQTADVFDKNLQALNDYIKFCYDNGAEPVGVILPFAPSARKHYKEIFLNSFVDILAEFERLYDLKVINFFDYNFNEEDFSDATHLIKEGAMQMSTVLMLEMHKLKIFSDEDFYSMSYLYFTVLSYLMEKNAFLTFLEQIFSHTLEKLRRKKKIKIAFVTDHAACWCGDRLYNLFAQNERFETTVFFCRSGSGESTLEDARHDIEQFKSSGIDAVGILDLTTETVPQDIIIFLRPYISFLSKSFQFNVLTPQTLLIYIPYGIETIPMTYYNIPVFRLAWKIFFDTEFSRHLFDEKCSIGVPRGLVSGQPKLDSLFGDTSKRSFAWKMIRPNAKKIIWAPHHTITMFDNLLNYATFQCNYKFMYEFAKAHPETSWVFKPHPRLSYAAVVNKLFPSVEAYEEYLQKWNDLPNAQVFTGGYYQEIFSTSDGMIHDSLSFIAEYQYVNKPMIFLLNNDQEKFTELGKKILDVSYLVDGKNFKHIADAVQKIFIEGNDPLKEARQKVFDEELNYYRINGMSASEFIYKNIIEELELKS